MPRELPDGRREYELRVGGRTVAIGLGVLAIVIVAIVVATGGDGGSSPPVPPRSASLEHQLHALDQAVRALD